MAQLRPDQLDEAIRAGRLGSIYLFDGPEAFLKERAVEAIIDRLVPKEARDFNLERFDGNHCTGGQIVTAAQGLPFLGDRRVIVVQAAEELAAADARAVGECLTDLPSSTCLLFLWEGRAGLRDELPAKAGSNGAIVTCWTPFPNQLPTWIMNEARRRGKPIASDAAAALAESCGDLQQMVNEYDKLSLFVGKKPKIEMSDLLEHGLPDESGDHRGFEDALWARDVGGTLRQGQLMAEAGTRAEQIYPLFERVFRTLVLAHHLKDSRGATLEAIFGELGIRGKTQQANLQMGMRAYRAAEARAAFDRIARADLELKTGVLPSNVGVSLLVLGVVGKGGA